ncbi:heat shock transcription factor, Y-linked-like [Phascolarctos cinereus]|uniref:Heat shock transcription factor, Y-linked-like n=1 Tax=Phascolarctos cinereus TaxID=38626 RepID=A0A6P5JHZ7_PHACI|nr:heat shock transcription factor, Y-linked-like [Phascolarctos cinereus]
MDSGKSEPQENSPRGGPTDTEHSNNSTFYSVPLERGETPVMDADLPALVEENAFQALIGGTLTKRARFTFPDESLIMEENEFFSLTFPRKLWKIVESDRFKSIWWSEDGTHIVINEEQFKEEILEKKRPMRIFETDCMKSFIRQLNLYGFSKIRQELERSASLDSFLMEEKETFPSSKLQLYYNPNFKRGYPHLVSRLKRRVGVKNKTNHLLLTSQNVSNNFLKGDYYHLEDQKFALTGRPAEKCSAFAAASSASASASASASPSASAPASSSSSFSSFLSSFLSSSAAASVSSPSSPSPSSPPPSTSSSSSSTSREKGPESVESRHFSEKKSASSPVCRSSFSTSSLLGGTPHARLNQFTPFHMAHLGDHPQLNMHGTDGIAATASLYHAIWNGSFRCVAYPAMYSELTAIQAHVASLLPFCGPCYPMPMVATTSASSMAMPPEDRPSSQYQHCPSCSCTSPNKGQCSEGDPRGD